MTSFCLLPSALRLVLLIKPDPQRREVFDQSARVHLALAGEDLECIRPGAALTHGQHLVQTLPGSTASVDRATMQWTLEAGNAAERAVKLELQDAGYEVTGIRHIRGDVVLRAGVEVRHATVGRRRDSLVFQPERPPTFVVLLRTDAPGEDFP